MNACSTAGGRAETASSNVPTQSVMTSLAATACTSTTRRARGLPTTDALARTHLFRLSIRPVRAGTGRRGTAASGLSAASATTRASRSVAPTPGAARQRPRQRTSSRAAASQAAAAAPPAQQWAQLRRRTRPKRRCASCASRRAARTCCSRARRDPNPRRERSRRGALLTGPALTAAARRQVRPSLPVQQLREQVVGQVPDVPSAGDGSSACVFVMSTARRLRDVFCRPVRWWTSAEKAPAAHIALPGSRCAIRRASTDVAGEGRRTACILGREDRPFRRAGGEKGHFWG